MGAVDENSVLSVEADVIWKFLIFISYSPFTVNDMAIRFMG